MADGSHVIHGSSPPREESHIWPIWHEILSSIASETQIDYNRSTDECVTGFVNEVSQGLTDIFQKVRNTELCSRP